MYSFIFSSSGIFSISSSSISLPIFLYKTYAYDISSIHFFSEKISTILGSINVKSFVLLFSSSFISIVNLLLVFEFLKTILCSIYFQNSSSNPSNCFMSLNSSKRDAANSLYAFVSFNVSKSFSLCFAYISFLRSHAVNMSSNAV